MPNTRFPRHGSMQFWPRVRAKRAYARQRTHNVKKDSPVSGFAGYKVGMTHVQYVDTKKTSPTKNEVISVPVTLIECPPIKILSVRFYKKNYYGNNLILEVLNPKLDKELEKKVFLPKNIKTKLPQSVENFSEIRLNVHTQPKLTGIGKKKPEVFEISIAGTVAEQFEYAKNNFEKEISVKDVFKPGQLLDIHAVTKGKGYQGAVKRFGVRLRHHKSEKVRRGVGTLSSWSAQQHIMYRVPHPGKMGFHQRTDYNKWLIAITPNTNSSSFFDHYGIPKNDVLVIKGSVAGHQKRLIRLGHAIRPDPKLQLPAPELK